MTAARRSICDDPSPSSWPRGLVYLVVFYVGAAIASPGVQMVKSYVAASDERVARINHDSAEALRNRDWTAMNQTADRLEIEVQRLRVVRLLVFAGAALMLGGLCLMFVGTWNVTVQPISWWETAGRYIAVLPLILVLFVAAGIKTGSMEFLMMVAGLVISTSHEIAFEKIAGKTGNSDLASRMEWNSRAIRGLLIVCALAMLLHGIRTLDENLFAGIRWGVALGAIIVSLIQARTFGQLQRRLR